MTLICFASQKGSPGATATALAVAASLSVAEGRRKLLLEADSTGGTLAIRYRLPVEPGLLTLAAAARTELTSDELWRHARELPGGLPVIVCPDGPEQVHAAMAASGATLGCFLAGLRDVDVICDVGRLAPESPSLAFVAEASALLMVARPNAEQLQPAARRMIMLKQQVSNIGWVLVGQKPYGPAEVEATYDFPVVGVIADDPRSVASFESGVVSKRLRRHPFLRSSTMLANTLSEWLSPITLSTPKPGPGRAPAPPVPQPQAQVRTESPAESPGHAHQAQPGSAGSVRPAGPRDQQPGPPTAGLATPPPPDEQPSWARVPSPGIEMPTQPDREPGSDPASQTVVVSSVAAALPEPTLAIDEPPDDWDGSAFTTTADLRDVFIRPDANGSAKPSGERQAANARPPHPQALPTETPWTEASPAVDGASAEAEKRDPDWLAG